MANRTLGPLCRMFNFALDREWVDASPAARIQPPGTEHSRERVLTDYEIRTLWSALDSFRDVSEPAEEQPEGGDGASRPTISRATASAFQVQLLTAQRPGEVRAMRWQDVDFESKWWTVPAKHSKNGQPHRVPLTEPTVKLLQERQVINPDAKWVFENRPGQGPIVHRGKKAASALSRKLKVDFRAHDLRRTAATIMAAAGVSRAHIARVLNHIEGGPAATRVYDRYAVRSGEASCARSPGVALDRDHHGKGRQDSAVPVALDRHQRCRSVVTALASEVTVVGSIGAGTTEAPVRITKSGRIDWGKGDLDGRLHELSTVEMRIAFWQAVLEECPDRFADLRARAARIIRAP